jgi:hypothetical protein
MVPGRCHVPGMRQLGRGPGARIPCYSRHAAPPDNDPSVLPAVPARIKQALLAAFQI